MRDTRSPLTLARPLLAILLALIAVAAMGCWPCPKCPECPICPPPCPPPCPPAPVEHQLFIQKSGERCQIVDANGNTSVSLKRGEWVVWSNALGRDVRLQFSATQKIFGVETAIVYAAGDPLKLQLRNDAAEGEFAYHVEGCTAYPGPIIIIPPPGP